MPEEPENEPGKATEPPEKMDKEHGEEVPSKPEETPETVEQIVKRGRQMGF
ncbi:MAG: hypothetical protein SFU53_07990 [Terrimicrobiaceae bacterium]|nr:hypothetical protein [Terrimicrobiaceae bacterium]